MAAAENSRRISPGNVAYRWSVRTYATHSAAGVRRVIDRHPKTYSLWLLLDKISRNPQVITRRSFVSRYPKAMRTLGVADADFDGIVGEGVHRLPRAVACRDIEILENVRSQTEAVANHHFLHYQRKSRSKKSLTWRDLEKVISDIDAVCARWNLILLQGGDQSMGCFIPSDIDPDCHLVWGSRE